MIKKLIRHKIPHIAEQNGDRKGMELVKFKEDNTYELEWLFKRKLIEEANEIHQAKNDIDLKYEICDLLQALDEFMILKGITDEEIETIMKAKAFTSGKYVLPADDGDFDWSVYVLTLEEEINE